MNVRKLIKVILLIGLIASLAYAGACIYANVKMVNNQNAITLPKLEEAQYEVVVANTGRLIYSNDVTRTGSFVIINKYWDYQGKSFVFRKDTLRLDENIYGKVTINLRRK
jgi:hypothetical protein